MTGTSVPAPFEARMDPDGVMYLSGELDMSTADSFTRTLASTMDGQLPVLDLSELTFLDSSGIRAILQLRRSSQQTVVLRNVRPNVGRVLAVAGVNEAIGIRIDPAP